MNKKRLTIVFSIIFGAVLMVSAIFSASAYSDSDPLITLSYLQEIFAPSLKQEILSDIENGFVSEDEIQPESEPENAPETEQETVPAVSEQENRAESVDNIADTSQSPSYTLLELSHGQTVMAQSICEFIVRPGSKVAVISPFPSQGIADITNGVEVLSGEMVSINAYCLIPRGGDGRGITVIGEKAYVMIRGDYTIG